MIHGSLKILAAIVLCAASAQAQISTSLKIKKTDHLAGESVIAVVTITNHAGRELAFKSDGRFQWLDFIVKKGNGTPVNPRGRYIFGPMKIAAGQTLAREVDLSQHFQLGEPGNFSVSAVIHMPGSETEGTATNRALFNQSSGNAYWRQKVGVTVGGNRTREYRLINFSGDSKTRIYIQIADGSTGLLVCTYSLGDVLMIRKPVATVDRQQRMHVLYLATPTTYVHYVVNTDGKVVAREFHQRGPSGDPQLLTFADGTVKVTNSIPYDPKAAAEERAKVRKASDRPSIVY